MTDLDYTTAELRAAFAPMGQPHPAEFALTDLRAAKLALSDFCRGINCQGLYYDIILDGDDTLPSWATDADRLELDRLLADLRAARGQVSEAGQ